jgi:ABC-type Fe3+ transport system substrate-binding protein
VNTFSRRRVLGAGAVLGATVLGVSAAASAEAAVDGEAPRRFRSGVSVREETKSLDELYADARQEGGELIVYAGGDQASQQDAVVKGFASQFPDIKLTMVVDYSKYHDVRIDNQLATGTLVPDVVELQTLQDFTRWKDMGVLLPYKPAGFSALYPAFRDPDGAWVAIQVLAFSFMYNVAEAGGAAPATPLNLADPRWKGAIASSYPNDDDSVLYLYKLYAEAYGWDWVSQLAAQSVQFARGSYSPLVATASGQKAIGIGTGGSLVTLLAPGTRWIAPPDGHPFMAWGQRAAILAGASHPAAAKLYLNWQISAAGQHQTAFTGWSVRTDITPAAGLKPIWEFPNAHLDGFPRFLSDRAEAERWGQTFTLYFGEVQGAPTPGWLGLHPGQ